MHLKGWVPWAFLITAVGAWSLSPLLILSASHIALAPVVALYAVIIGSIFVFLASLPSKRFNFRAAFSETRKGNRTLAAAGVGVGAFVAYPMLYFSAIQTGPPILVNLVNYLWPIVGLLIVALYRRQGRSLELILAGVFGFAGATLAITASKSASSTGFVATHAWPFLLAGMGAVLYGGVSAAITMTNQGSPTARLSFLIVALLTGGFVCLLLLMGLILAGAVPLVPSLTVTRGLSLVTYSLLLPCAHFSWFMAIQDRRVPAFSSAFLVPVLATGILALVTTGYIGPRIFAALTLVLCGIAFATTHPTGVPAAFAVLLSALGSIQVSQALSQSNSIALSPSSSALQDPLIALVSIISGFVLSNAIDRYGKVQTACLNFYRRAVSFIDSQRKDVVDELDELDATVLRARVANRHGSVQAKRSSKVFSNQLSAEWSEVEVALHNRVSSYEWLVLVLGGIGIILTLQLSAESSSSLVTFTLKSFAIAVVVGVLFAVRDYDQNRPDKLAAMLRILRERYGLPLSDETAIYKFTLERSRTGGSATFIRVGLSILALIALFSIAWNTNG